MVDIVEFKKILNHLLTIRCIHYSVNEISRLSKLKDFSENVIDKYNMTEWTGDKADVDFLRNLYIRVAHAD